MDKLRLYRLSIGHNNKTKKLELDKIKAIANRFFDGYSLLQGMGYWKGLQEKTAFLDIATNENEKVIGLANELKRVLKQEAILVSRTGTAELI